MEGPALRGGSFRVPVSSTRLARMAGRQIPLFFATMAMVFLACGGGDGGGDDVAADESADGPAEKDESTPIPAACPTSLPFDVEVRLGGDGAREAMTVVDSVALRRSEGRAWTVYLADFDMPDDTSWSLSVPDVPPGSTLVTTGLDVFNAPDVGALPIFDVGSVGGLFGVVGDGEPATFLHVASDTSGSSSVDQAGETELLHLADDLICFETEITGESGLELVGTYATSEIVDI